jgi:hypothetical protein
MLTLTLLTYQHACVNKTWSQQEVTVHTCDLHAEENDISFCLEECFFITCIVKCYLWKTYHF